MEKPLFVKFGQLHINIYAITAVKDDDNRPNNSKIYTTGGIERPFLVAKTVDAVLAEIKNTK